MDSMIVQMWLILYVCAINQSWSWPHLTVTITGWAKPNFPRNSFAQASPGQALGPVFCALGGDGPGWLCVPALAAVSITEYPFPAATYIDNNVWQYLGPRCWWLDPAVVLYLWDPFCHCSHWIPRIPIPCCNCHTTKELQWSRSFSKTSIREHRLPNTPICAKWELHHYLLSQPPVCTPNR